MLVVRRIQEWPDDDLSVTDLASERASGRTVAIKETDGLTFSDVTPPPPSSPLLLPTLTSED